MTQPPDDRVSEPPQEPGRPPAEPPEPSAPGSVTGPPPSADAPTVTWTPPPDATPPADATATPDGTPTPDTTPSTTDASPPASPLISWTPSGGAVPGPGAEIHDGPAPGGLPPGGMPPVVGWEKPDERQRASPVAGYVVAGTAARVVAYAFDGMLLGLVTIGISRILSTTADPSLATPALLVGQVIVLGLEFLYFVGFWTSRGRATPGMRVLRIQVIDARADRALRMAPATARWLLLSGAIGLFGILPLASGMVGIASLLWVVALLGSVIVNPLRQGIHDQAAGSLVVQPVGVRSNAAAVGCLLLLVFLVILPILGLILFGDMVEEILLEVGQSI